MRMAFRVRSRTSALVRPLATRTFSTLASTVSQGYKAKPWKTMATLEFSLDCLRPR